MQCPRWILEDDKLLGHIRQLAADKVAAEYERKIDDFLDKEMRGSSEISNPPGLRSLVAP